MGKFDEKIKKIAEDVLNLEINTILSDNIEGVKMPGPRHALLDIAKGYDLRLTLMGAERMKPPEKHNDFGGWESFHQLRERANKEILRIEGDKDLNNETRANLNLLYRIKDKSDQLKGLLAGKNGVWVQGISREQINENNVNYSLLLSPSELVLIRKAWELGTEEIAMQTVIQLDGDVITRIQRNYADPNPVNVTIHKLHNEGVSKSIFFWKELIGIIGDFFNLIFKVFFRK